MQERMTTHVELARAVFRFVSRAVAFPQGGCQVQSVTAPLFPSSFPDLEEALLYGESGTWSERVALLFVTVAKACHLHAVAVPGYWRSPQLMPGEFLQVHNHCWNAVKVEGRWRLVDCTAGAATRGHGVFFTAPEHFRMTYQPLDAPWSLLRAYISNEAFFAQPWIAPAFFNMGNRLLTKGLPAVRRLQAPVEGASLPVLCISLAIAPGLKCVAPVVLTVN
jgi:hypothetical protein